MEGCLGVLLSFSEDDPENILRTHERLSPYLPSGAIPVADDGGGDFVCLDYSGGGSPRIGYWHHGDRSLVPLASSFGACIGSLKPVSDFEHR